MPEIVLNPKILGPPEIGGPSLKSFQPNGKSARLFRALSGTNDPTSIFKVCSLRFKSQLFLLLFFRTAERNSNVETLTPFLLQDRPIITILGS